MQIQTLAVVFVVFLFVVVVFIFVVFVVIVFVVVVFVDVVFVVIVFVVFVVIVFVVVVFVVNQMSEGSEVSKVTLCVKILKWQSVSQSVSESLTKVRYRAARAAKNSKMLSSFSYASAHHSDQMSEGSQVSKVTICVEILKWQ